MPEANPNEPEKHVYRLEADCTVEATSLEAVYRMLAKHFAKRADRKPSSIFATGVLNITRLENVVISHPVDEE